jgi:thiamine-monophosphate kinase
MPEFELIRRLQDRIVSPLSNAVAGCAVGIGDDGAVLEVPSDRQLVVCTDTLVAGVHFPAGTGPRAIGHKALAVNLSDLAAMGAEPAWFFLALTIPEEEGSWLDEFAAGMASLARETNILLAGGDTTSGPLSVTVTALGLVEPGRALLRSGAREGDLVVVSGAPGRAGRALEEIGQGREPEPALRAALDFPQPRLALGRALQGVASACIDVSDGLLADLGHILDQSAVGAELFLDALPAGGALAGLGEDHRWALQLGGGDDYELCFTVAAAAGSTIAEIAKKHDIALSVIGRVIAGEGVRLFRPDGRPFTLEHAGYQHFAGSNSEAS